MTEMSQRKKKPDTWCWL